MLYSVSTVVEDLAHNMPSSKQTDLNILDFSKAVDKVNLIELLHKLQTHGSYINSISLWGEVRLWFLMETAWTNFKFHQGFHRAQFWVPSYFSSM